MTNTILQGVQVNLICSATLLSIGNDIGEKDRNFKDGERWFLFKRGGLGHIAAERV